jgi:hypothetical protein
VRSGHVDVEGEVAHEVPVEWDNHKRTWRELRKEVK